MMKICLLCDDRIGNVNQVLGLAQALDLPYDRIDVKYNNLVKLPNFIRGNSLMGVKNKNDIKKAIKSSSFDMIISAGRRAFPVARWMKKRLKNRPKLVHLMNVGHFERRFADLLVIPQHDNFTSNTQNVYFSTGAPHLITPQKLQGERAKWAPQFARYKAPILSLIIGGATKDKPFTLDMAKLLVERVKKLNPTSILITTSRRTPENIVAYLRDAFDTKTTYFYAYGDTGENPYFGLLSMADIIVVTGDSISMCSEACATPAAVYIFSPNTMVGEKHKRFHQILYKNGHAHPLSSQPLPPNPTKSPFTPATDIANHIKKLWDL